MSELYRDFIDRKADQIITDLGGTITPAPSNAELYRDFLGRKFDDVITAITNMSTGGVLSGDTAPNNADGDNNDLYIQYDSSYNVVALYVKLNDVWRSISTSGSTHTYSTTEQIVGTWIDGSPIYEKSFSITSPEKNVSTNIIEITSLSVDDVVSLEGVINAVSNAIYIGNSNWQMWTRMNWEDTNKDYIACSITNYAYAVQPLVVTIRYTKTST